MINKEQKKPIVLCFEIDKQNFDEVSRVNSFAIPDLEKALVKLGPLPASSYDEGTKVVYCVSIYYQDFSIPDILKVFQEFGLVANLKEGDAYE